MRTPPRDDDHVSTSSSSVSPAPNANLKRRRFLLALGAGSAATAAATAQSVAAPVAQSTIAEAPAEKQGYRETQHVRDYYASTRL